MKISFVISVVSTTVLSQIGLVGAQDRNDVIPLKANTVILPGDINACPAANILETARASIRSEIDNLLTNATILLNRPSLWLWCSSSWMEKDGVSQYD